jgi:hypothetical protein
MRQFFSLLLVLAVLLSAGCVEEESANTTAATAPAPVATAAVTGTSASGPAATPTPPPAEMAYLAGIKCALGDKSEAAYHCNGDVRIRSGVYDEVQIIATYPDNNTFRSGVVSLGGNDAVSKPFFLFPDLKYQGQTPKYFIRLDSAVYPVIMSGEGGTAWSNMPPA